MDYIQVRRQLKIADDTYEQQVVTLRRQFEVEMRSVARERDLKKKNILERASAAAKVRASSPVHQRRKEAELAKKLMAPPLSLDQLDPKPDLRPTSSIFVADTIMQALENIKARNRPYVLVQEVEHIASTLVNTAVESSIDGVGGVLKSADTKQIRLKENRIKAKVRVKEAVERKKKMKEEEEREAERKRIDVETRRKAKSLALAMRDKADKEKEERLHLRKLEMSKRVTNAASSPKRSKTPQANVNYVVPMALAAEKVLSPKTVEVLANTMYPDPATLHGNQAPTCTILIAGQRDPVGGGQDEERGVESFVRNKKPEIPKAGDTLWVLQQDEQGSIVTSKLIPIEEQTNAAKAKRIKEEQELDKLKEDAFFHGGLDRYRAGRAEALTRLQRHGLSPTNHSRASSPERPTRLVASSSGRGTMANESGTPAMDFINPRAEKAVSHLILKIKKRANPRKKCKLNETELKMTRGPFAQSFKGKYAELDAPLIIGARRPKADKKKKKQQQQQQKEQSESPSEEERRMNPLPSPSAT